ncbi:MAG: O-methyltransferase [Chloroflexota bacterium]
MSTSGGYIPSPVDRAWIESNAAPIDPALGAIETAAEPQDIPILDRESGRILTVLAAGRHAIVEVGTAYGFSTLCLALGAARDATIATIDPDRGRTDLARGWWRQAGIADERIVVVNRPALEAFAAGADEPALVGPFDFAFIDAIKAEYPGYLEAVVPRLLPGAMVVADNVLWSGAVSGDKPSSRAGGSTEAIRAFDTAVLRDRRFRATILPVGDGMLIASYRG